MAADVDQLYLSRAEMKQLIALLRRIPALINELAITETRQAVVKSGLGAPRCRQEPQLPMHIGAYLAAEALYIELIGWVKLVAEQRALTPPRIRDTRRAARWLDRHVVSLAMTEGSETALDDIKAAGTQCEIVMDLPLDDDIVIDQARLRAANNKVVTAYQVEKLAAKLGDVGKGLNRDRVRYLTKKGLQEVDRDGETKFYRLGDVLAVHVQHPRRPRRPQSIA
ncbi:hypothetical protein [Nocardia abscessus]|uniref:hypothetical protein n=1 Tax=Nocardia abscessus TaxID=120957 RepID=UPI001E2DA228|nr:hypothetical protein [Nocardia abscessus]